MEKEVKATKYEDVEVAEVEDSTSRLHIIVAVGTVGLFIADRFLHMITPPVDMGIYGALIAYATGQEGILYNILKGKK